MSFFHSAKTIGNSQEVPSESSSSPLDKTLCQPTDDKAQIISKLEYDSNLLNTSSSTVQIEIHQQTSIRDSQEISSLLNDTILGLEEVGDLLQASLKEIEVIIKTRATIILLITTRLLVKSYAYHR